MSTSAPVSAATFSSHFMRSGGHREAGAVARLQESLIRVLDGSEPNSQELRADLVLLVAWLLSTREKPFGTRFDTGSYPIRISNQDLDLLIKATLKVWLYCNMDHLRVLQILARFSRERNPADPERYRFDTLQKWASSMLVGDPKELRARLLQS